MGVRAAGAELQGVGETGGAQTQASERGDGRRGRERWTGRRQCLALGCKGSLARACGGLSVWAPGGGGGKASRARVAGVGGKAGSNVLS